jgi:hypothetical protein
MESVDRRFVGDRPDAVRVAAAHAAVSGALVALLDIVPELESDEAWIRNAATDMTSWLTFDLGLAPRTARSWIKVGKALPGLPLIREALQSGTISFDEAAVLVRFADAGNEKKLLRLTREVAQADLAKSIKELLSSEPVRPEPDDHVQPPPPCVLRMWWDEDEFHYRGRARGADGVMVEMALLTLAAKAPLDASGLFRDPEERQGEALVQMASEALAREGNHDRATVVVHVSAQELGDPNSSALVAGKLVDREELLRLACDGRMQPAIDDADGFTIGVGRVSRQIPSWLRRLMTERDGGCRFPGCSRTRWTHGHHLVHWANGGPTNLDNLVTLCGFHHRLIHAQGWQIRGNPGGDLVFLNKWGSVHEPIRAKWDAGHVERLLDGIGSYGSGRLRRMALANSPP